MPRSTTHQKNQFRYTSAVCETPPGKMYYAFPTVHDKFEATNIDCLIVEQYVKRRDPDAMNDQVWHCKKAMHQP